MRKRMESPAETLCKLNQLRGIYRRQFEELAPLRRHICSLLPLGQVNSVFEPGCGTGLLCRELQNLTDVLCSGMDIAPAILPDGEQFIRGDAEKNPIPADMYVTSFFFSSLKDPVLWLKRVRKNLPSGGLFAVFCEYNYTRTGESPDMGLADSVRCGLMRDSINTVHGSRLDYFFRKAGFTRLHGGEVKSSLQKPDRVFLEMHTGIQTLPDVLPLMSWCIVWGIWRSNL